VDGNDDFLDGLMAWLGESLDIDVVGRAHSGAEAMAQVERLEPDLCLLDLSLQDASGLAVTRRIKALRPQVRVLLLTFHESQALTRAALIAGADGCVSKTDVTNRLLPEIARLDIHSSSGRER